MRTDYFDDLLPDYKRYSYRFLLYDGEGGGIYRTNEPSLNEARDSLVNQYGDRLALVVKA